MQKGKKSYLEHLKEEEHFLCTEIDGVQKPVVFEIKSDGIHLIETEKENDDQKQNSIAQKPHYYG